MALLIARQRRTDCCGVSHLCALLGAVLGAALAPVADAGGVEAAANHLVTEARQVADATAADQDDRMLLEIVTFSWNVGADFHPVGQPHAGDLAQRRVRLLGRRRIDARADTALLRRTAQ